MGIIYRVGMVVVAFSMSVFVARECRADGEALYDQAMRLLEKRWPHRIVVVLDRSERGHLLESRRARELLNAAAKENHPGAMLELGEMCLSGEGGPIDLKSAHRLFSEAASKSSEPRALFHLAQIHFSGNKFLGIEKDENLAQKYYNRAYDVLNADILLEEKLFKGARLNSEEKAALTRKLSHLYLTLGELIVSPMRPASKDSEKKATPYFEKAAKLGSPLAEVYVAAKLMSSKDKGKRKKGLELLLKAQRSKRADVYNAIAGLPDKVMSENIKMDRLHGWYRREEEVRAWKLRSARIELLEPFREVSRLTDMRYLKLKYGDFSEEFPDEVEKRLLSSDFKKNSLRTSSILEVKEDIQRIQEAAEMGSEDAIHLINQWKARENFFNEIQSKTANESSKKNHAKFSLAVMLMAQGKSEDAKLLVHRVWQGS